MKQVRRRQEGLSELEKMNVFRLEILKGKTKKQASQEVSRQNRIRKYEEQE